MKKIKVSIVSYINTLPFQFGIYNSEYIANNCIIEHDVPSDCARKLLNNEADVGLVPVVLLIDNPEFNIISDYCLGAIGAVESVSLFSQVEISKVKKILLDPQSNTSINLAKILALKYWNISPEFIQAQEGYEELLKDTTAGVVIGDRALLNHVKYKYVYDLSLEWYKFTGMPFVFACWVASRKVDSVFINNFNKALSYGVSNLPKVLLKYGYDENDKVGLYLKHSIKYSFNKEMKAGLQQFFNLYSVCFK